MQNNVDKSTDVVMETSTPSIARISIRTPPKTSPRAKTARSTRYVDPLMFSRNRFGSDAPQITIGSSRTTSCVDLMSPGPTSYDPPRQPIDHKIGHVFPRQKSEHSLVTITSHIDFADNRRFPENRPITIGRRDRRSFFIINDAPGPSYMPVGTLSTRGARISVRQERKAEPPTPGPGYYNPKDWRLHSQTTPIARDKRDRSAWMIAESSPGPADYTPQRKHHEPDYLIGKRSINRRKNSRITIGFDVFLITIDDANISESAALEYVRSHQEFKSVLHNVLTEVFEKKPKAPLAYIRDYFIRLKKGIVEEEDIEEEEEFVKDYSLW